MDMNDLAKVAGTSLGGPEYVVLNEAAGQPLVFSILRRWANVNSHICTLFSRSRVVSVCTFSVFPLILLCIRYWPYSLISAGWAVWLSVADCVMVLCAWRVWDVALSAGPPVNAMLQDVPEEQKRLLESWYLKWFRILPQTAAGIVGSAVITWAALLLPTYIVQRTPVTIAALLLSGFISGFGAYSIAFTCAFCYRFSRVPGMTMLWNAPIRTPGMIALSAAVQLEAKVGMIMFVPDTAPLLYGYIRIHNSPMRLLLLFLMISPISCVAIVGLIAQGWLAQPVRHFKNEVLQQVANSISLAGNAGQISKLNHAELVKVKDQLDIFDKLSASPESFLQTTAISQYVAAFIAALIPLIVAFLFR